MTAGVLVASGEDVGVIPGVSVASADREQPKSRRLMIRKIIGVQKLCFCCSEAEPPNSGWGRVGKCKGMDNVN